MENASKALLMAGSILIGVLIMSLMVTVFMSTNTIYAEHEETKKSEAIQQFNVNFTKFLGKDITIHEVVTICNYASIDSNKVHEVTVVDKSLFTVQRIKADIAEAQSVYEADKEHIKKVEVVYRMSLEYDTTGDTGYVSRISFTKKGKKITYLDGTVDYT